MAPDRKFLPFLAHPVPMREEVEHGFSSPPGLVIEVVVFRKAASIHNSEVRTDARPFIRRWLPAIIETGPDKTAGEKGAFGEDFPPAFGVETVVGKVDVVSADVAFLFVIRIDPTRAVGACCFGANSR